MKHPKDLDAMKDAIEGYEAYRHRKGLPATTVWRDEVRAGLIKRGDYQAKRIRPRPGTPESES